MLPALLGLGVAERLVLGFWVATFITASLMLGFLLPLLEQLKDSLDRRSRLKREEHRRRMLARSSSCTDSSSDTDAEGLKSRHGVCSSACTPKPLARSEHILFSATITCFFLMIRMACFVCFKSQVCGCGV